MENYLVFSSNGFKDYLYWQKENKKILQRINELIKSIQRDGPLQGIGKPEVLKGNYKGCYSRRIDEKNRLIYNVNKDDQSNKTLVSSCCEHYPKIENENKKALLQCLEI